MEDSNLQRMIRLAEEFFETRTDPDQIAVDAAIIERLREIHPSTLAEERDDNGPVAWILLIPTTLKVMSDFVRGTINERMLLESTLPGDRYEAIYLCSALVLPEYRGKGLAKRLALGAIRSIQTDHPITHLYYWAFSDEGKRLAESIAHELGLPLFSRTE